MGDFDDGFLPVGHPEEAPEPERAPWRDNKLDTSPAPEECPECGGPLERDFECGYYVIFKCQSCGLNIRHFPPEQLATWRGEDDEEEEED